MLQQRTEIGAAIAVLSEWQLGVNEAFLVSKVSPEGFLGADRICNRSHSKPR